MIDTKVKVNGKTVGEYDLIKEPCVKRVNGEGPDDNGNVEVEGGGGGTASGPTINGGYDVEELVTLTDETATSGQLLTNHSAVNKFFMGHSGDTVVVTFDGTPYQCSIIDDSHGRYHVGDPDFIEYPFHISSSFLIDSNPNDPVYLHTATTGESHTVKIEGYRTTPVVFDRKYIPNLQALTNSMVWQKGRFLVVNDNGVPEWVSFKDTTIDYAVIKSSTSGSSKKFKLTVEDSGTISATEITS